VFREVDGRNYVPTGDWAKVDADGGVNLLGRGSNCINSGGEKIFPEEVEEAIKRHANVDDCLVVGLPDERFGQRAVGVIGTSSGTPLSGDELREWLRSALSHFKISKSVVMVPWCDVRRMEGPKTTGRGTRRLVTSPEVDGSAAARRRRRRS
jgi:fatty-acyl-CoA synthase